MNDSTTPTTSQAEQIYAAGKDAAAKERENRLAAAKKKLKTYRARQSKNGSIASTASSSDSIASPRSARRESGLSNSSYVDSIGSSGHKHRRSISKTALLGGPVGPPSMGHGRRASKSRHSRGSSMSMSFGGGGGGAGTPTTAGGASKGHGHTRSRASISISLSGPPPSAGAAISSFLPPPPSSQLDARPKSSPPLASAAPSAPSPFGWTAQGSPDPMLVGNRRRESSPATTATPSFNGDASPLPTAHERRASRHNRRSSVANFRESLEIVSGQGNFTGSLQPAISSFAASGSSPRPDGSPSASPAALSSHHSSPIPQVAWSNDPAKVLEALKERGRRESDDAQSPGETRRGALEALEGRLAAPSEMIDLGNEAEGQLLVAPKSPGFTAGAFPPTSPNPSFPHSPMIGLGVTNKRSSWSTPGPLTADGAKGAMDLGSLMEEEEEEEEDVVAPLGSPKRKGTPKKRPSSLIVPSPADRALGLAVEGTPEPEQTPAPTPSFARHMRPLSLSLSSVSGGTPSTSASLVAPNLRPPPASSPPLNDERTTSPLLGNGEQPKRISLFHTVAVATANGVDLPQPYASSSSAATSSPAQRGGLRSLSIGGHTTQSPATDSPTRRPLPNEVAPPPRRSASTSQARGVPTKRSSISYRNTSVSSLASPDGPLSAASQAGRRPWRTSMGGGQSGSNPASPSAAGYNPFAFGGFGDLEQSTEQDRFEQEEKVFPTVGAFGTSTIFSTNHHIAEDSHALTLQIQALRTQIEQLKSAGVQLSSTHALEIAEFEKKAGEEARSMRSRIGDLERQLDEAKIARRFEVEGLSREIEQSREVMADLSDERDSLKEDVDGWRQRCQSLEANARKEREDEALAKAQAKLIGEMRDQIYNLVAALDRERGEHGETRQEVERLMLERANSTPRHHLDEEDVDEDEEAAIGSPSTRRQRQFKNASDGSVLSTSSYGRSFSGNTTEDTSIMTDLEDSFSMGKMSSPPSGHSSFAGFAASASNASSSKGRDSDFGGAAALNQLQTLAEEDEEDEETVNERIRHASASTGSTSSEAMPLTPSKDAPMRHDRSDSFVRHWSFPKGSVSSVRISSDDHTFFDLNRHTSLPALPFDATSFPPFVTADLTVEEDEYSLYDPHPAPSAPTSHARRPSSPRPLDRMNPHARRFSGQYATKQPPISPSALVHAHLTSTSLHMGDPRQPSLPTSTSSAPPPPSSAALSRLSFGNLIGSLGGWSPASAAPAVNPTTLSKMAIATTIEDEKEQVEDEQQYYMSASSTKHHTPPSLLHSQKTRGRYIKASEVRRPKASRLAILDFTPACCGETRVYMV